MEDHTVLVVDDEPASLRALQRTLSLQHRVLAADRAERALEILAAEPVSLLVTDHRMPGLTGIEMLARSRRSHPDVVRIVLTGFADLEATIEAINEGAVFYYLTKPWEPRDLLQAVRRGLDSLEAERQRRRLLEDLEDACARARREAEQKTRLLTTAAHELGTPVHLLGNAVDLLAGLDGVRDSEWLAIADRSLGWLRRSLAQMHTGFRLRGGRLRLTPVPLDLAGRLHALLDDVTRAAAARRLGFERRIEATLPLRADARWLDQAWICLLSNAVRFTPDGGRITVAARRLDATIAVEIADTGVGMSAEQLAGAFEAFSTAAGDLLLHGSGRLEFGARGMGLGLSIAHALVRAHGGDVRLESALGRGTVVDVRLPAGAGREGAPLHR